ncbi:MAG: hypothetical protein JWR15_2492 [Prosthecobacter sp.]|nr:hypothetical protein [Prosthecobacter sp.]
MSAMNDEPPNNRSSKTAAIVALLVALPLLYVLSVGPVGMLFEESTWFRRRPRLKNAMAIVYSPLKPLFTHESLGPLFQRYLSWWDELARKPYMGPDPFAPAAQDPIDPFAQEPSSPEVQEPK